MQLEQVVPWGRSLLEYQAMFNLSPADLNKTILGCSDGPASLNAELCEQGGQITSIDPVYQFSRQQLEARVNEVAPIVMEEVKQNQHKFNWQFYSDSDALYQARMTAMKHFLADFELGKQQQRYQTASLPTLNFANKQFDLALCSHFLFLYSEHFDTAFHIAAIKTLCRVAKQIRIYPLLTLSNQVSPHLEPVLNWLKAHGYHAELISVNYEFQKGAKQMLQITAQ